MPAPDLRRKWAVRRLITPQGGRQLTIIIRRAGYRGYLPVETLASGRKGYDSFVEVPKIPAELNAAIAATASLPPDHGKK